MTQEKKFKEALSAHGCAIVRADGHIMSTEKVVLDMYAEALSEARDLRDVLLRHGFRKCDIPACNCDSWHHVDGLAARFREIEEVVGDHNGKTLLQAIKDVLTKLNNIREAAQALVSECDGLYVSDVTGRATGKDISALAIRDVEVARKKLAKVLRILRLKVRTLPGSLMLRLRRVSASRSENIKSAAF